MLKRKKAINDVKNLINLFPVTAILGPRQCGKTTLAREISADHYFDLENPRDLIQFDNPQLILEKLKGLVVIDEIQRKPDLFPLLRYLVDYNKDQKYLILGSASRELIKQSSETLAGRIAYYELEGFSFFELTDDDFEKHWIRGGFPLSYLAPDDMSSNLWRENYVTTFLERDIPQLGIKIPSHTLRRFWIMIAHYHGQILNFSELGKSFGISDTTAKNYLDILCNTFMVRLVYPWYENVGKRLVKRPKLYIRDSGIFHTLMSIDNKKNLFTNSKLGASFEGYALETVINSIGNKSENLYFWATHSGAELDLFWKEKGKNWGVEFKYQDAPNITKSMQIAIQDLNLNHLWIIYPGSKPYILSEKISVIPIKNIKETWDYPDI